MLTDPQNNPEVLLLAPFNRSYFYHCPYFTGEEETEAARGPVPHQADGGAGTEPSTLAPRSSLNLYAPLLVLCDFRTRASLQLFCLGLSPQLALLATNMLVLKQAPPYYCLAATPRWVQGEDAFLGGAHEALSTWFLLQGTQPGTCLLVTLKAPLQSPSVKSPWLGLFLQPATSLLFHLVDLITVTSSSKPSWTLFPQLSPAAVWLRPTSSAPNVIGTERLMSWCHCLLGGLFLPFSVSPLGPRTTPCSPGGCGSLEYVLAYRYISPRNLWKSVENRYYRNR